MNTLSDFFNYSISLGKGVIINTKDIIFVIVVILITAVILKYIRKIISKRLEDESRNKFNTVFNFISWFFHTIIFLFALHFAGVNVTAIIASAAALLIGVGMALRTLFQDIISGISVLVDKTIRVGDIIEIENKMAKVTKINLRTTQVTMINNKVITIPNHLFLTQKLINWTQNGKMTREFITVRVTLDSDVALVKKLLKQAANENHLVIKIPPPLVIFTDIAESSLNFKLIFTVTDSFNARIPKSEIRFRVVELFKQNNITIAYPHRVIHLLEKKKQD